MTKEIQMPNDRMRFVAGALQGIWHASFKSLSFGFLSLFFCFLLAGSQTVLTVDRFAAAGASQADCACSDCSTAPCCACRSAPVSQPLPLAPARTAASTEVQALAAGLAQPMASPA